MAMRIGLPATRRLALAVAAALAGTAVAPFAGGAWPVSADAGTTSPVAAYAPSPPREMQGSAGDGAARVKWLPPEDSGGSPIIHYTVTAHPGGASAISTPNVFHASVAGLANGETYAFTVTATNRAGTSEASEPSNEITPHQPLGPRARYEKAVDKAKAKVANARTMADDRFEAASQKGRARLESANDRAHK